MKKIVQGILIVSMSVLVPGLCTMAIHGRTGGNQKKMGISVTLQNGKTIDGEQFVTGMAATELSYVREEEAIKAWMIVCRTNFLKAAGTGKQVNAEDLSL